MSAYNMPVDVRPDGLNAVFPSTLVKAVDYFVKQKESGVVEFINSDEFEDQIPAYATRFDNGVRTSPWPDNVTM